MAKMEGSEVIMVTGGTGLIGCALQRITEKTNNPNEKWVFLSSKDGDLV